ncbi:DNA repair protein RecO [Sansalvadorimonas sp. 2012CJ34-2]|uniref:DNA repair protein RecO n=1 Tax=Parendozoicomonas callyspongiae TaxID=2942213 RepID=A0ABT0PFP7_9GAMM|nr:DNA repair protein RecO [Sansalvadorimonas sp. 2012CJ34-2]MCL6270194.1 DNA repair protein RecO [Sansalvadorimonas sp. 2012CJ34-2]
MLTRSVELQPVWVLHSRPYRETSLIVDLLSRDHGKVSVVANGARGTATKKGKPRRGQLLQPFTELLVSWAGKTELKTLKALEQGKVIPLTGSRLFCGLYANELLQRLLQPWQPVEDIPELYQWLVNHLLDDDLPLEPLLRLFEKQLLECLGYGLPLGFEAGSGAEMVPDLFYRYDPESGFWPLSIADSSVENVVNCFSGAVLLGFAQNSVHSDNALPKLKRLMRMALAPLLDEKPLRSRELFRSYT